MESVLLFCCRAFLKGNGENNREFYELLGVEKNASTEEIKKAYKKQSLQMHPDKLAQRGVEVTSEHSVRFQKMKDAYDVLSDAKRRKLYDEIGASGLKLLESPQEMNIPEMIKNFQNNRADRAKIALLVVLIFAIILLEPILFCLKCDRTISSEWLAIWAPIWGLDLILLVAAIFSFLEGDPQVEEGEEPPEKESTLMKVFNLLQTCAFILMQIFILMRLDKRVEWSWFAVFAPWFIWEAMFTSTFIPTAIRTVTKPEEMTQHGMLSEEEEEPMQNLVRETKYFQEQVQQVVARKYLVTLCLRVWLAVFLALKVNHTVDWNWGLVLLPIWLYFAVQIAFSRFLSRWAAGMTVGEDVAAALASGAEVDPATMMRHQHAMELKAQAGALIIFQFVPLYMAILLVVRLQTAAFSTFIILLPIYTSVGCCLCGVCCGFFCISNMDIDSLDQSIDEAAAQGAAGGKAAGTTDGGGVDSNGVGTVYGTFHEEEQKETIRPAESVSVVLPPPPPASSSASESVAAPTAHLVVPGEAGSPVVEDRPATSPTPPPPALPPLLKETTIDADID